MPTPEDRAFRSELLQCLRGIAASLQELANPRLRLDPDGSVHMLEADRPAWRQLEALRKRYGEDRK